MYFLKSLKTTKYAPISTLNKIISTKNKKVLKYVFSILDIYIIFSNARVFKIQNQYETDFSTQTTAGLLALNSDPTLASCVTLGHVINFSGFRFLHLSNRDNCNFCFTAVNSRQVIDKFTSYFYEKTYRRYSVWGVKERRKSTWTLDIRVRHTSRTRSQTLGGILASLNV